MREGVENLGAGKECEERARSAVFTEDGLCSRFEDNLGVPVWRESMRCTHPLAVAMDGDPVMQKWEDENRERKKKHGITAAG